MSPSPHANRQAATARLRPLLDQPAVVALGSLPPECDVLLVGGALRDRLLERPVHDFDAVVAHDGAAAAERVAELLETRAIRLGGDRFAAYRIEGAGFRLDLWDRQGMSLDADLRRRDLTVNSMALRLSAAELLDPHGGLDDLAHRRLRATSEASFADDPLRVLRLARFVVELPSFAVDPKTVALARAAAPGLERVAAERIREELRAIFDAPRAAVGLGLLVELEVYPGLWSDSEEPASDDEVARLERLAQTIAHIEAELGRRCVDRFVATQATLFSRFREPVERLRAVRQRRLLSNRDAAAIESLLGWPRLPSSIEERRWFLHNCGDLWPTVAAHLGSASPAADWRSERSALIELARSEAQAIFAPPPLLDGHEIASLLGLAPGPRLGELASDLRRAQIEGRVTTRDAAVDWLERKAKS